MPFDDLLTPREVAAILRLRERSVLTGSLRKDLPWTKVGNLLRVRERDLKAYLKTHSKPANAAAAVAHE